MVRVMVRVEGGCGLADFLGCVPWGKRPDCGHVFVVSEVGGVETSFFVEFVHGWKGMACLHGKVVRSRV